jgi:dihydroorotate dehydrogenase (NAD+) catalytic subunit
MSINLEVNVGGLVMKNPVTVGSGTFAYGQEYNRYFDVSQLGAVTTKSLSLKPRAGNVPPRLVETPAGMLNAIGLQNVGIETYLKEKAPFLRERGCTVIGNIYGYSPEEYAELAQRLEAEGGADAIEANLSCPNVHDARVARGCTLVAQIPEEVKRYTQAIKAVCKLPLFIKLSPNVIDIAEPALAAEEAGADGVSLINTILGLGIDPESRRPILHNIVGGLSGPRDPAGRREDGVGRSQGAEDPHHRHGRYLHGGRRHAVHPRRGHGGLGGLLLVPAARRLAARGRGTSRLLRAPPGRRHPQPHRRCSAIILPFA